MSMDAQDKIARCAAFAVHACPLVWSAFRRRTRIVLLVCSERSRVGTLRMKSGQQCAGQHTLGPEERGHGAQSKRRPDVTPCFQAVSTGR